MNTLRADLAIVGAGLAGMALALDAARRGQSVILLERRSRAGGAVLGLPGVDAPDNSVHLFLAAFSRCRRRLAELGSLPWLREMEPACQLEVDGRLLRAPLGAGRVGTLGRLILLRHPAGSGWGLVRSLLELERRPPRPGETAAQWQARARLPKVDDGGLAGRFWREWSLSVFNAPLERVDADLFRRTQRALFPDPQAHRPWLSTVSLERLWVEPFRRALQDAGVRMLAGCAVQAAERRGDQIKALIAKGIRVEAKRFVWAAGPHGLARTPGLADVAPPFPPLEEGRHIVNVRLPATGGPRPTCLLGWFGKPFQWVFAAPDGAWVLVGSGWTDEDLARRAEWLEQVPAWLSTHGLAGDLSNARWLVQRHATALQSPAFEAARPQARSRLENLFFCGAWLATGLPLSMESALAGAERTLQALQFD